MTALTLARSYRADRHLLPDTARSAFRPAAPTPPNLSPSAAPRSEPAQASARRLRAPAQEADGEWKAVAGAAVIIAVKMSMLWAAFHPV
jgi:hypothetical protein